MKTLYNKLIVLGLIVPIISLCVVSPVLAVETPVQEQGGSAAVCTRLQNYDKTVGENLSNQLTKVYTNFNDRSANIISKQSTIDQKLLGDRASAKTRFESKITELLAKEGLTDSQRQAIETFKTNVEAAMLTRQTAVDDARAAYRKALSDNVTEHQASLLKAVATYRAAVTAAFDDAKSSCSTGSQVMATLRNAIKTARQNLDSARQDTRATADIATLIKTRNTAIQTANDTFKASVSQYRLELRTALDLK